MAPVPTEKFSYFLIGPEFWGSHSQKDSSQKSNCDRQKSAWLPFLRGDEREPDFSSRAGVSSSDRDTVIERGLVRSRAHVAFTDSKERWKAASWEDQMAPDGGRGCTRWWELRIILGPGPHFLMHSIVHEVFAHRIGDPQPQFSWYFFHFLRHLGHRSRRIGKVSALEA